MVKSVSVTRERIGSISFNDAAEELRGIISGPDIPDGAAASARRLVCTALHRCLLIVPNVEGMPPHGNPLIQPSDLFRRFVDACRSKDWSLALLIEREAALGDAHG